MSWAHEIRRGQIYSEKDYSHFIEPALLACAVIEGIHSCTEFMISDRLPSVFRRGYEPNIGKKDMGFHPHIALSEEHLARL
ncbi:hypothetical protein [Rhizobium sp. LEGMi135b]